MITTAETLAIISNCRLLQSLSNDVCEDVVGNGRFSHTKKGDYFFHQGDDATVLYIILEGRVKLSQVTSSGDQIIVNYFGPGDELGIVVALSGMDYPLSTEAVTECTAVSWHRDTMRQLALQYPQIALNGMEMIAERFVTMQAKFIDLSTRQVEHRVARALARLARQFGKPTGDGLLIDMPLSRQDLAEMTGTNLYNVSRILKKWERAGWVSGKRQHIVLSNGQELIAFAEDFY